MLVNNDGTELPRYLPEYAPGDNPDFPWHVVDRLEGEHDFLGPCFNPRDAALIAWALNRRKELIQVFADLAELTHTCVDVREPEQEDCPHPGCAYTADHGGPHLVGGVET